MKDTRSVQSCKPRVDIIIPSVNNTDYLRVCLTSIVRFTSEPFRLIIVNNGGDYIARLENYPYCEVIALPKNLGWMGGVNAGIERSLGYPDSEFILWMNDDTQVLDHDYGWLTKMILAFQLDPKIGAVGPMSNRVMGQQSTGYVGLPPNLETTRLSGFCFLTKKSIVKKIGVLDESLPGGDDLDYSIRLRSAGYKLAICRRSFILHHYSVTGKRIFGDYWDSREHIENINKAIIHKHGFRAWFEQNNDILHPAVDDAQDYETLERRVVLSHLNGELSDGLVLDLGCGGKKFDEKAIGVDMRQNGTIGVGANVFAKSVAEVECDVLDLKPFKDSTVDAVVAKHLLEHILDIPKALKEWLRVLKPGGKVIVICPDWRFCEAISCDPSHVHALTPESLKSLFEVVGGFEVTSSQREMPGYIFSLVAKKVS